MLNQNLEFEMQNESKKIKIKGIPFGVLLAGKVHDGSKTVTRRVVKSEFPDLHVKDWKFAGINLHDDFPNHAEFRRDAEANENFISQSIFTPCPYTVGQLLYVREPWRVVSEYNIPSGSSHIPDRAKVQYLADNENPHFHDEKREYIFGRSRIARFMPARFARTFLRVTGIDCRRLLDTSEADAINEGVERIVWSRNMENGAWIDYQYKGSDFKHGLKTPIESFFSLWDSINGKDSHLENPWVWVISFVKVDMPNPWNEENEFAWGWRKAMVGYVSDACAGLLLQVVPDMATGLFVGFLNDTNLGDFKTYPAAQLACKKAAMNHFLGLSPVKL